MGVPSIDETILSFVEPRWKKVAKVIYQVTVKMSDVCRKETRVVR